MLFTLSCSFALYMAREALDLKTTSALLAYNSKLKPLLILAPWSHMIGAKRGGGHVTIIGSCDHNICRLRIYTETHLCQLYGHIFNIYPYIFIQNQDNLGGFKGGNGRVCKAPYPSTGP